MVKLYSENGHYNGHYNGNGHHEEKTPSWWAPRGKVEHSDREMAARAFNLGSDARINGLSLCDNPYPSNGLLTKYWEQGWQDVEQNWGKWARWPVTPIPTVSEG